MRSRNRLYVTFWNETGNEIAGSIHATDQIKLINNQLFERKIIVLTILLCVYSTESSTSHVLTDRYVKSRSIYFAMESALSFLPNKFTVHEIFAELSQYQD